MINSAQGKIFRDKLREKIMNLGFPKNTAISIASAITPIDFIDNKLTAHCASGFYKDAIIDKIFKDIELICKEVFGEETYLVLDSTNSSEELFEKTTEKTEKKAPKERKNTDVSIFDIQETNNSSLLQNTANEDKNIQPELQADMTFTSFVRGQSNSLAVSACEAVTSKPGKLNNPVFIYGDTGLGKTHLLHAVGNEIKKKHPSWNIVYITSGDFVTSFVASMRFQKMDTFRIKYLNCDVLLVDDIQFLESKEQTQQEFFHIFNILCTKKKQIVITSDKYPKDIPALSERLRSRFLQGLLADIEPPCFEERVAIIETKSAGLSLRLSKDITEFIATHVKSNIREIQGVLNNLLMQQTVSGNSPTIETTTNILRGMVKIQRPEIDIGMIQKAVATYYNIKLIDLTSASRSQKLVIPRHIAMFLAREIMGANLTDIAASFGRKDHTTVLNALNNVKNLLEKDASCKATVAELKRRLEQHH